MKIKFILLFGYFIILYIIAFCSNLKYREHDDVLWISRKQWEALLLLWILSWIILIDRRCI